MEKGLASSKYPTKASRWQIKKLEIAEKLETPKSLKILCIMSFIGFALAMAQDTSFYLTYGSIQDV